MAIIALLTAVALPSKEMALIAALVVIVIARPLNRTHISQVMYRCWPILAMLAIAATITLIDLSGSYDNRAFLRILFYYVRIPIFVLLGFAARRFVGNDRIVLWGIIAIGVWGAAQTLIRYATGGNLAGLDHNELRSVVGSGDTTSILIPLCALTLWPNTSSAIGKTTLVAAVILAVMGTVASDSRMGLLVLAISVALSFPKLKPLPVAYWGSVLILIITFVVTTPVFPPILSWFGVDHNSISVFAEVIARPRSDLKSISSQWRGYETYMAFLASAKDGFSLLLFGHGMSTFAPFGVLIELAPGQLFDRADVFHNGWSFIILHSGILGVVLYIFQFYMWSAPPSVSKEIVLRKDNRLFALVIISLAISTAVVAGMFNAGNFSSGHLFIIGFFYPYSFVPMSQPKAVSHLSNVGKLNWQR